MHAHDRCFRASGRGEGASMDPVQPAESVGVTDAELESLLQLVYVQGGFTDPELAASLFAANSVRARGELLVMRDPSTHALAGIVIVVPPHSPARRMAASDEAEMHLLAVAPELRGRGIGQSLVRAAMLIAKTGGYGRMVLWTQPSMHSAQRLYLQAGFVRAPERDWQRAGREFLVFQARL